MKNNFEGYLDLFRNLLTRTNENIKLNNSLSQSLIAWFKSKIYDANHDLSELKTSFDYSQFSSYQSGESIRRSAIQKAQNDLKEWESLSNSMCDAVLFITTNYYLNFAISVNAVVEFLNAIRHYKDSQIATYKLYGLACEVLRATTETFNFRNLITNNTLSDDFLEKLDNFLKNVSTYNGFDVNQYASLIDEQRTLINEFFSYEELIVVIKCAEKIVETDVLPEKLRYKEAADAIADYFTNRRVSNEKEAINLYFQELAAKEAADKAFAEEQKAREELNKEMMSVVKKIEDNIAEQNANTALVVRAFSKVHNEYTKDYNHLVDAHNDLVDKHNDLVDEIKKRG